MCSSSIFYSNNISVLFRLISHIMLHNLLKMLQHTGFSVTLAETILFLFENMLNFAVTNSIINMRNTLSIFFILFFSIGAFSQSCKLFTTNSKLSSSLINKIYQGNWYDMDCHRKWTEQIRWSQIYRLQTQEKMTSIRSTTMFARCLKTVKET